MTRPISVRPIVPSLSLANVTGYREAVLVIPRAAQATWYWHLGSHSPYLPVAKARPMPPGRRY